METVTEREERQLLDAVKRAADLVAGGLTPDAAVEKVARDAGFGPGKIRLIGQAYNTGQQLGQWRQPAGGSILDKLAAFPLCDPDAVIAAVYAGSEKAAAVSPEYARPPRDPHRPPPAREKTAAAPPPPRPPDIVSAYGNIARAKLAADETRRRAAAAADGVMAKVAHVVTYFKQAGAGRLPFEVVEAAARTYYGAPAGTLMDMVYARAGVREKRAGATPPVLRTPLDLRAEPFTLVKAAIDAAAAAAGLRAEAARLKEVYAAARGEQLRPFAAAAVEAAEEAAGRDLDGDGERGEGAEHRRKVLGEKRAFGFGTEVAAIAAGDILAHKATHGPTADDPYGDVSALDRELAAIREQSQRAIGVRRKPRVKQAFFGAGLGTAIGSTLGRTMGTVGQTKDDLVDDAWMGLEDPEHENALRKIKAQALINQLMTDPDDPISAHDPDKVLAAYNEISAAAPRVAETAATLRPALRRRLEGHTEPFESKEMLDIEHGLSRTKAPTPNTNILGGGAPGGLLG